MAQTRCRPGLAQKAKPRRFIPEILFADDLQSHRASEIDVERFVSDPHRTATQLDRFPIFTRDQSVMLKTLFRLFGCRVHRDLGSRRLAGLYPARQSLAEHTDRNCIVPESSLPQLGQVRWNSELGMPVAADSSPAASRRIQTGHKPLSPLAGNCVPQAGHVRISGWTNPAVSLAWAATSPGFVFTSSPFLWRQLELRKAHEFLHLHPRHPKPYG